MSALPMTTQDWQRQHLGPDFKRDAKWLMVDIRAFRIHTDALAEMFRELAPAATALMAALTAHHEQLEVA